MESISECVNNFAYITKIQIVYTSTTDQHKNIEIEKKGNEEI